MRLLVPEKQAGAQPGGLAPRQPIRRNAWAFVALSWLNPLLRTGRRTPLAEQNLPLLGASDSASTWSGSFDDFHARLRKARLQQSTAALPSVVKTLALHVAWPIIASVLLKLVHLALTLALPLAIPQVVQLLAPTPNGPSLLVSNGYAAAAMLLAMQLGLALADVSGKSVALAIEVRLRAILANAIFAKTLVLSPAARQSFSAGRVSNLMSSDITSILNLVKSMNDIWAVPVRVALSAYLIYVFLGNAMWVAVGAIVVLSIVQSAIGPRLGASVGKYVSAMDSRINTLREFLLGVRVVKLQALEESFVAKTTPIRETQMAALRSFISVLIALFTAIDVQIALVPPMTLAAHAAFGNTLQPGNVFAALSIFDGLLMPLQFLPQIISIMSETLVSYKRITEFLLADEIKPDEITQLLSASKSPDGTALKISAASFTWEEVKKDDDKPKPKSKRRIFKKKKSKDNVVANADADKKDGDAESDKPAPFALQDITLDIPRGSLVAVVGSVGSGKSSLLSALIGGMRKTAGDSALFGSVAYCAQEPWILTGTIEENIVFGNDAVRDRIPAAIAAACLDRDLEILPNGLGTQIGEKGINLSGGQKARVALARAIARDADIYLLDDPIAALDAHVGKKVFDDAICGVLRGKTVILVTHQLHLLPKVDTVVVLDEGRVVETGSFRELMAREDGALAEIMKDYHFDDAEAEAGKDAGDDADADGDKPEDIVKAVKAFEEEKAVEEDRRVGRVSLATYKAYFRAAGRWLLPTLAAVWLALLLGRLTPRVMLSIWTSGLNQFGLSTHQFMPLYVGLGAIEVLTDVAAQFVWFTGGFIASSVLHNNALTGLVRSPMAFFDGQPIGRILNRMSADVRETDMRMPNMLSNVMGSATLATVSITMISIASPILLILFVAILLISIALYRYYQASYREVKRLSSIMRSPLAAHVSESLNGIPTIMAFAAQSHFAATNMAKIDQANLSFMLLQSLELWLALRVGSISAIIVFALIALGSVGAVSRTFIAAALAETMSLTDMLLAFMSLVSMAEAAFNAVERLDHYGKDLPSEAARELPADPKDGDWPTTGAVAIRDLEIRYPSRPDHAVIQDLSLDIRPGEKVGVVGRTGSGKSTLMTALFRIMEASKGSIAIDGIDIASLGLKTLRSRLQIIPQEPVLFKGTVRSNLDFATKYTDDELWAALGLVGLKDFVGSLDGKLDAAIDENGANLSMGQRQLMCLCKAILAKPKVLIMDEATASVDAEADKRIQESIETQFAATTVLSIAHRLNTIAAFDRVLVLDGGRIAEFDAPHVLLGRAGSVFGDMVDATGAANAAVIRQIAADHHPKTQ